MEILIITGPPYCGKGTQCAVLETISGFKHISTGDRVRREKTEMTAFGEIVKSYEENGNLVPDEIMQGLIAQIIDENLGEKGIILDGYPRTVSQVDTILEVLAEKHLNVSCVINIVVPKEELLVRATKRAKESDRKDDQDPEIHLKRIEIFETQTGPAVEYMQQKFDVVNIDGLGTIGDITEAIRTAIDERI
ncbi:adenylate kinase family protein [Chitinophaga agri]|uniref:Adenylate kinase n=1 Tax=Chitinophaga agri TaxID=2703787 RepID=A0A6B9ZAN2_9BACT|nr:nucleoside monophosphate kinase [Chitinophaga agri]QHS59207.1 AAA family ATPase [Chitinophaga agri]